ncbi:extracellular solute-binding protein [Kineococcus sp. NPDC059986]|uniref:sugar ABC transporter substrate-binding protein n=1 Tax=Kineococcus sp. NPDC059986 TaxID=3155538 RepID=UPI00344DA6CE
MSNPAPRSQPGHLRPQGLSRRTLGQGAIVAALAAGGLSACGGGSGGEASSGSGKGSITVWAHQGQDSENAALEAAVKAFNASQKDVTVKLTLQPGDTYTTTVQNTSVDSLPDVLEMDGPTVASYVYDQRISALEGHVSADTLSNQTASAKGEGTVDGKVYAAAMYDSALGLYGNKKLLDAAGVKYPTALDEAWTAQEFDAALKTLAAANGGKALDIQEQNGLSGEWGTYAFAPLVWSAGGRLIEDDKATGVLDGPEAVGAVTAWASWKQFVDSNADAKAFTGGRVALGWGGHWNYPDYSKALGQDLVAMPLPNMGKGTKTGAGSWTWGISAGSGNAAAAGKFLDFLLNDENVKAMTDANGAPAATTSAGKAQTLYQSGGALALFGEQLAQSCGDDPKEGCVATARPVTAGYPVVTSSFGKALAAIYGGSDVQTELTTAAKTIDQAYADNNNYQ